MDTATREALIEAVTMSAQSPDMVDQSLIRSVGRPVDGPQARAILNALCVTSPEAARRARAAAKTIAPGRYVVRTRPAVLYDRIAVGFDGAGVFNLGPAADTGFFSVGAGQNDPVLGVPKTLVDTNNRSQAGFTATDAAYLFTRLGYSISLLTAPMVTNGAIEGAILQAVANACAMKLQLGSESVQWLQPLRSGRAYSNDPRTFGDLAAVAGVTGSALAGPVCCWRELEEPLPVAAGLTFFQPLVTAQFTMAAAADARLYIDIEWRGRSAVPVAQ